MPSEQPRKGNEQSRKGSEKAHREDDGHQRLQGLVKHEEERDDKDSELHEELFLRLADHTVRRPTAQSAKYNEV